MYIYVSKVSPAADTNRDTNLYRITLVTLTQECAAAGWCNSAATASHDFALIPLRATHAWRYLRAKTRTNDINRRCINTPAVYCAQYRRAKFTTYAR